MAKKKKPVAPGPGPGRTRAWIVVSNGQEIEVTASDHTILDNGALMLAGKGTARAFAPGAWSTLTLKPEPEG